jgi:hypothetical protein
MITRAGMNVKQTTPPRWREQAHDFPERAM